MTAAGEAGWRWRASLVLMAASGFAGLGYQIVWTQQCALWLGHESAAVLAVVAAFFGGLAVGALAMGPRIERSARPVRWYVGCEIAIALWGAVLAWLMPAFSGWVQTLTGAAPSPAWQWAVAFCGTFVLLLPATAAMGATLPAMERVMAHILEPRRDEAGERPAPPGRSIAAHYASNTLGAVLGVLATAFWLVPVWGLTRTAGVCIALNLLCAAIAWRVMPSRDAALSAPALPAAQEPLARAAQTSAAHAARTSAARTALGRLACTGALGIGYEVLVARVLGQVTEDTVYTFAMLLAVYLFGSALGAAGYHRWLAQRADFEKLGNRLLGVLAAACLMGTASLWAAEQIKAVWLSAWGVGMPAAIGAEAAMALAAFGPATVVMGALFSHLSAEARASGVSFGRALGVNTLGAAVAPLCMGVLLTPWLGPKWVLLLIAIGYLALMTRRTWRLPAVWVPAGAALALALLAPPLAFVDVPEGGHVVRYLEGVMAAVSVVEDADGVARLRINNRQQEGSSATLLVDGRQALLPLLLHPAPRQALFLGVGTGMTASAAADDPTLQVDAVELLPDVIAASGDFTRMFDGGLPNPRLHLMAADARRYVRATARRYDVIVSDNFHPARSGSGSLYTVEHFRAVQASLAAGGVFCQWLPLHQLDLETLRSIVQSFIAVYPNGTAMLASNSLETPVLGLVGHQGAAQVDIADVRTRLAHAAWPRPPAEFAIEDEYALLGSFVAGPQALARFAGDAPANTDDHPVVAYLAPRVTYAPETQPRDRLLALLHELSIAPGDVVTATDVTASRRLAAYWAARDRYIAVGQRVRPSTNVQEMLAQVRQPLLGVLRTSPDFRPAYDPLVRMAGALAGVDPAAAQALLAELALMQPARPEALSVLQQLGLPAP